MSERVPSVFDGCSYSTAEGEDFLVVDLDSAKGQAVVARRDGRFGVMEIADMLEGIRSGALTVVDDEPTRVGDSDED